MSHFFIKFCTHTEDMNTYNVKQNTDFSFNDFTIFVLCVHVLGGI